MGCIISALNLAAFFLEGWALTTIWNWYVTPFFDIREMQMGYALGIILLWNVVASSYRERSEEERFVAAGINVFNPPFAVFLAWIIKSSI